MTHKDIYIKFMIEYDKANVTSSYPSLTEYEVATVLDKAYNALIAQKITGNNIRRTRFESDVKSVSDLQNLVKTTGFAIMEPKNYVYTDNVVYCTLPNDFMYFVAATVNVRQFNAENRINGTLPGKTTDVSRKESSTYASPVKLISHDMADQFRVSQYNIPWIKQPVCYIEDNTMIILHDPYKALANSNGTITYVQKPNTFVKDIDILKSVDNNSTISYFRYDGNDSRISSLYNFELNDTMAEELISLAITFALENVESTRLTAHANLRGLES